MGWNISCVLEGYDKFDYRNLEIDPNALSHHGDPSYINAYFGKMVVLLVSFFLLELLTSQLNRPK